mmetsp:Transcript_70721/g.218713  ORF Transcript_70721/g.218713 Transcript_70721/m.218713 type:complete len:526 (+) Transcript_70721:115-1692(+)|eukprot:CAMPEP_0204570836 /NCGR_PEP_ID=MMETSP0661-20131031/38545_1 /ASSEMBLY_ACC=CAM_ASM_000606 /TAXON_ID=109239 /ORGANISM="Alexandrium margalefi, Strain AMGDE01CS-322" /LENGTH=525 /DNA_ID=CAMNT_0051579053 /DNA_START=108 /DNA_END=1685 /DNA_ORIENTATION=-
MFDNVDDQEACEEESTGFCSDMCGALCGVCIGCIFMPLVIFLLGWNEFDFVRNQAVLIAVQGDAVEASCAIDPGHDGKLVHVSCPLTSMHTFVGAEADAFKLFTGSNLSGAWLRADAEIWQVIEEKHSETKKDLVGGGKTTKSWYTRDRVWSRTPVNSSEFHCKSRAQPECINTTEEAVENVGSIPERLSFTLMAPAGSVRVGDAPGSGYALNAELIEQMNSSVQVPVMQHLRRAPFKGALGTPYPEVGGRLAFKQLPAVTTPTIGDLRVSFWKSRSVEGSMLSIVAAQKGEELQPYKVRNNAGTMASVNWLHEGSKSLEEMVNDRRRVNVRRMWTLRIGGFLLLWGCLMLIVGPLEKLADVIPCVGPLLGDLVGCVVSIITFFVAAALALVTIGIAWVLARPLVGAVLLGSALVLVVCAACAWYALRREKDEGDAEKLLEEGGQGDPGYGASGSAETPAKPPAVSAEGVLGPGPGQVTVTCPQGCGPGAQLDVGLPDGARCPAEVPEGVAPGEQFVTDGPRSEY